MKFKDLSGKIKSINLGPNKRIMGANSKSKCQSILGDILISIWPNVTIYEEVPCCGTKLRLDFYIPTLNIAIEMQGRQHDEMVPFFHKNKYGFMLSRSRDFTKDEWCKINNITLIKIFEKDLNKEMIRQIINESISRDI